MIVKLTKDLKGPNPAYDFRKRPNQQNEHPDVIYPAGTIIDHADGHYLMKAGLAEAADEEATQEFSQHKARKQRVLKERAEKIRATRKSARRIEPRRVEPRTVPPKAT